jgi:uncharacterized protein YeaO (DUF488 family)
MLPDELPGNGIREKGVALHRYRMVRGARAPDDPLPEGLRLDTRKHTRHVLRPTSEMVRRFLEAPGNEEWDAFRREYLALLAERFAADRKPFDDLAFVARRRDVYLGCSCPTKRNPRIDRCHTVLALRFMQERYPELEVVIP